MIEAIGGGGRLHGYVGKVENHGGGSHYIRPFISGGGRIIIEGPPCLPMGHTTF